MDPWVLTYEGYEPEEEGLREALCTVGNGYFCSRGAAAESSADGTHYPGTYVACLYDRLTTEVSGRPVVNEDLVNVPNWTKLEVRIDDGSWFSLADVDIEEYRQALDLKNGILTRDVTFAQDGRRTKIVTRRFVHMAHRHIAGIETSLTPLDWSGSVEVRAALDGTVENAGVARYSELASKHLAPLSSGIENDETVHLTVETVQSRIRIAQASRVQVFLDDEPIDVPRTLVDRPMYVAQEFAVDVPQGSTLRVEKIIAMFTSRDRAISDATDEARLHATRARDFGHLAEYHALTWAHLWRRFRLEIAGAPRASLVMNLHVFHLLQTVSVHAIDQDVGVPARGWHGEAYRGHIFWDELFIFPFINLHQPEITRSLLLYRYRRLTEARHAAFDAGYRGAMFPWQSGSNGREETQTVHLNPRSGEWVPDNSHRQRHISSAVAFNTWQYYQASADLEFMSFYGAEMILAIARFWASIAEYVEEEDRYVIRGVMGPDEYHEGYPWDDAPVGVDNNAYTNIMAVWVLLRALDALELLPLYRRLEITEQLEITPEELKRWEEITTKMKICFHDGVISQFEGYDRLLEFDWEGYREKYGDIHRLDRILGAEGDTADRYKLSKQADVLMLFYLFSVDELTQLFERLGYEFTPETVQTNVEYYGARTSHGSTLSGVVQAWVIARFDRKRSWALFQEALESDIGDVQGGTTQEGVHLGAMAGSVDIMQRCYAGIEMREDILRLSPVMPPDLDEIRLNIRYRGQWLDVEIRCEELRVRADAAEKAPIRLAVGDEIHDVVPGMELRFDIGCCEDREEEACD